MYGWFGCPRLVGGGLGLIELLDVIAGDTLLVVVRVKDRRPIGAALIGALAVEGGGVVGDGEKDLQQLAVTGLGRVVGDLDRLGVVGALGADDVVLRLFLRAAAVAGDDFDDARHILEDGLHAPEAPAGDDHLLWAGIGGNLQIFIGGREGFVIDGAARAGGRTKTEHDQAPSENMFTG